MSPGLTADLRSAYVDDDDKSKGGSDVAARKKGEEEEEECPIFMPDQLHLSEYR